MSEFNPKYELEGIVRKLTKIKKLNRDSGDKRIIIVDESNNQIVTKTRPFRKYRRYLVYCDQVLKGEIRDIEIEDFDSLDSIKLNISYKIQCPYENTEKFIEKLFYGTGENPKRRLHALIERFIEDYVDKFESTSEFFNKFYQYKHNLLKELKKRVEREVGLRFDAHIGLKNEDNLEAIEIEDGFFEVFVKSYDRVLQLKYKAILDVHPEFKVNAILKFEKQNDLRVIIKNQIKKILRDKIDLDEYINHSDLVKEKITHSLNEILIKEGRTFFPLTFENKSLINDSEKEFQLEDFPVSCKLKDSNIEITHNLILKLNDLGKYKSSPIKDLRQWVEGKLNSITKSVFFGKTYLDLILSYEKEGEKPSGDEIKTKMSIEAQKVGFTVQQLITIPKVKPLELLNGFSFDVGETEEFSTINTRIKVKLVISVSGRIIDLRKIEKYINPNIDIIEKMKEKVKLSVKQVIDKIEPERYYIRFKYADTGLGDMKTVEEELVEVISKKLKKEFHINELSVIPKPLDTDITVRFAELKSLFPEFEFETFPFRQGGSGEKVKFKVRYLIENVHPKGWHQFQSKKFKSIEEEEKQISTLLKEHLQVTLSTIKSEEIIFKRHLDVIKLIKIANLQLSPIISRAFGLIVKIIFIGRDATGLESRFHDRRQKVIDIHDAKIEIEKETSIKLAGLKKTELESLIEKYQQLQSIPEYADSDEAETIKKKIEEFPSEFGDIDIGEGLVDEFEEEDGNDLDDLLSFLDGDKGKQLGDGSYEDKAQDLIDNEGDKNDDNIIIEVSE